MCSIIISMSGINLKTQNLPICFYKCKIIRNIIMFLKIFDLMLKKKSILIEGFFHLLRHIHVRPNYATTKHTVGGYFG